MGVWDDVVGQEAVVGVFEAAARSARTVAETRESAAEAPRTSSRTGRGTGSGTAPEVPGDVGAAGAADTTDGSAMTHAWLVTGPPGSGRSNAARALAAAPHCTVPTPGRGPCKPCRDGLSRLHPDFVRPATR